MPKSKIWLWFAANIHKIIRQAAAKQILSKIQLQILSCITNHMTFQWEEKMILRNLIILKSILILLIDSLKYSHLSISVLKLLATELVKEFKRFL
jgi:hypothetical protein